ncbi:delta-60 repeat domain-containing protein [Desulfosediminicola sp.]|uniref:delta-60 repeat domain-containing protein n=1 Tax=Desulfosediminicola sp. TaxID=2886825 RepID=UPI003AF31073
MKDLGRVRVSVICFSVLVLFAIYLFPGNAFSVDAQDLLGGGGLILTDFNNDNDAAYDIVQQPDGKLVAVGFGNNGAVRNVAVARYLESGELDSSFSNDGRATFSVGSGESVGRAVALQEDGAIVVAGTSTNGDQDLFVLRLTPDGELDNTFGAYGIETLPAPGSDEYVYTVAVAEDGSIILGGGSMLPSEPLASLVIKLAGNGDLLSDFGEDGKALLDREYNNVIYSLILLDDGAILATGANTANNRYEASLVQFQADGSLDDDYAESGELSFVYEDNNTRMFDLLSLSDGSVITLGFTYTNSFREPLIARVSAVGELVESFGDNGFVLSPLSADGLTGMVIQQDDLLITTSLTTAPNGDDLIIIKVEETLEDGVAITTSYLTLSSTEYESDTLSTVLSEEGNVIVAGFASNGENDDLALQDYGADLTNDNISVGVGVSGEDYTITTFAVTDVQRNSATSGGSVVASSSEDDCIETTCSSECTTLGSSICNSCLEVCEPPAVILRGVAYGIAPNPSYRESGESDDVTTDDEEAGSGVFPASDSSWNYDTVRTGQTEDGAGVGEFGSDMYPITPGQRYYARAYAVLEDDTVIHGNQVSFKTDDSCFIATAAYGSIDEEHVKVLRRFRDEVLNSYKPGRKFIEIYYNLSPSIADRIEQNNFLKSVVRVALMPVIGFCYLVLQGRLWLIGLLLCVITITFMALARKRERRRI